MPTGLGAGFAPLANSTGAGRLAPGLSRGLGVEGAPLTGLSFAEHSFELIGNAQGPGPAAHVGLVQLALHEKDVFDVEEIPWPSRQQFEENQILGGDQVHGLSLDLVEDAATHHLLLELIFHEKDIQLQSFRVALSLQTAKTIKRGMSLIGIQVPERM